MYAEFPYGACDGLFALEELDVKLEMFEELKAESKSVLQNCVRKMSRGREQAGVLLSQPSDSVAFVHCGNPLTGINMCRGRVAS